MNAHPPIAVSTSEDGPANLRAIETQPFGFANIVCVIGGVATIVIVIVDRNPWWIGVMPGIIAPFIVVRPQFGTPPGLLPTSGMSSHAPLLRANFPVSR
ncbi:MAG: hypothetical protein E6J87_24380 [Deltaproteobacteria bacterium]|nr:MAG: hypothetical protein E6J87_24380 [Deltaproteobacteria bacterium]